MRARSRLSVLWRDRAGRFSALKTATLVAVTLPALLLALRWSFVGLGARPLNAAIHEVGLWGLRLLLLSLAISPARAVFGWARGLLIRRMLGLAAASYIAAHFTLYALDQRFQPLHIGHEIVHRVYLAIGFAALLGLAALAATSTDAMIRRLRRRWKQLHRLVYAVAVLGLLHGLMQAKSDITQPAILVGFFAWEMLFRALPARRQSASAVLFALALAAAVATAGLEAGWYAAATNLPWRRVLDANLMPVLYGPRPSAWVGMVALAVALLATASTFISRRGRAGPSAPEPAPLRG